MTLKVRILQSLTRLFIILVSLMMSLFSEKMLIFNRCISGSMSNLIEKSWKVSSFYAICYTRSERSCLHNNPNSRKTLITLCHIVRFYAICYTRSERSCLHNSPMYSMASASLFRTLCRLFFVRS